MCERVCVCVCLFVELSYVGLDASRCEAQSEQKANSFKPHYVCNDPCHVTDP